LGSWPSFLKSESPDVLCLQETKVINDLFPAEAFRKLGYVHQAINGQKGYHGVAIVSRLPFSKTQARRASAARTILAIWQSPSKTGSSCTISMCRRGDIPDPKLNEKFAHKLGFLGEMASMFGKRRGKKTARTILVGDLNVAPLEHDVWSHKQLLDVVSHTPVETGLLGEVKAAFDWTDVTREFVPHNEKIYSWWSYRAQDWEDVGSRPQARSHLGRPGPQGRGHVAGDPSKDSRLATAFRSRAGGGDDRDVVDQFSECQNGSVLANFFQRLTALPQLRDARSRCQP
jgi:exodeoxyribonuclease-3